MAGLRFPCGSLGAGVKRWMGCVWGRPGSGRGPVRSSPRQFAGAELVLKAADPGDFGAQRALLELDIDPVLALHALLREQALARDQEAELLLQRLKAPVEEFDDD